MSGFVGWVNFDGRPVDRSEVAALTGLLAARGPDRQGLWCQGQAGFGHALLATSDRARREQQPRIVRPELILIADARLDGRPELRAQLSALGWPANPYATDPELIGQAYLTWGNRALDRLQGDFAFVLWDRRAQTLFAARDPFGVKLLFYARLGSTLLVGNDLRCLRQHPAVPSTLNEAAIADFLLFDFNRQPDTTSFQAIRRLPGGHWLRARPDGCQTQRYWTLPVPELRRYRRPADCLAEFQFQLERAVGDRLPDDRAALYLSGGLDSPTLAAAARAVKPHLDLQGFTTVYERRFADPERHYAPLAAAALAIPLQLLAADDCPLYQGWATELLPPEPSHSPLLQLDREQLQRIARHSRVALYGEGADEALQPSTVVEMLRGLPLMVSLSSLARCLLVERLRPEWGTGIGSLLRRGSRQPPRLPPYPDWLNPDFARRTQARDRWQQVWQAKTAATPHPWRSRADRALRSDLWLPTLAACDPGFLNLPVETRLPFLDLRLLDFLLALPPLPWFVQKGLLRQAGRDRLPAAILQRPKTSLAVAPVLLALEQGGSPWDVLPDAANTDKSGIKAYVDCDRLRANLLGRNFANAPRAAGIVADCSLTPAQVWSQLRPVSLHYWLQRCGSLGCQNPPASANTVDST